MGALPTVIRCTPCSLNTLATLISTILPMPRRFRCDDPRSHPRLAVPSPIRLLEGWREVILYFCRDPTLWLFYHLFIIFAQLYICPPRTPPLIVSHIHDIHLLCMKIPLFWAIPLVLRFWDPVFF